MDLNILTKMTDNKTVVIRTETLQEGMTMAQLFNLMSGGDGHMMAMARMCDGCEKNIPVNSVGFKCQFCNAEFDMCTECVSKGKDTKKCPPGWKCGNQIN